MPYGSIGSAQPLGAGWGYQSLADYNKMPGSMPLLGQAPDVMAGLNTALPQLGEVTAGKPTWHGGLLDDMMPKQTVGKNGVVTNDMGWGMPALGVASGAFNAWMGMKQYGLAKKQLAEGKQQFALNYDAQRTTTNAQLEDRQRARVASNAGAYQSVGDYMGANGIRPRG